ncbi:MAG: hypothetical protein JWR07_2262 [Nevskia sp.]|nr:hypothetical protein [Nevskia sp.]
MEQDTSIKPEQEHAARLRALKMGVGLMILALPDANAWADRFSSDLGITAHANISVAADSAHPVPSSPAVGNATQAATLSLISGGMTSAVAVDGNLVVTGRLPLSGALLDSGDGVGIAATMSGIDDGKPASSDGLFGDYAFSISNRSATDPYKLSLKIDYGNSVQASGAVSAQDGAFNIGLITLNRGDVALFFTNLTSDTVFGDKHDITFTGTSGKDLHDAGTRTVDLTVQPGETVELRGQHDLRGGASHAGALYQGKLQAFISVAAVVDLAAAVTAPLPVAASQQATAEAAKGAHFGLFKPLVVGLAVLAGIVLLLRKRRK